jgi:TolB-like protein/DNA-binding winged helix-turn-helix (wHTH) protein/Tfp pilus assembly protein PilF
MATANDTVNLFNGFILDRTRGCLVHSGQPVHLRPQSYQVLEYLVTNAGQLISKDKLIEAVWNGRAVTDGAVGKCIEDLRVVFGEKGRQYLKNVRGRGYIFDRDEADFQTTHTEELDVIRVVVEEDDNHATVRESDSLQTGTRLSSLRTAVIVAAVVLFGVFGTYWVFAGRQPAATNIQSIAVMPLKNESGNSEVDYLSDGMTESLINSLSRLPGLSVKSRGVVFRYKDKDLEPRKIAAELSVQAILSGRFVQRGDDVTLYVSLVDGKTGNQIWGEQYDRKLSQLAALERDTSRDIAERLNSKLRPSDQTQLSHGSTKNSEAYRTYLKGRYYWNNPRLGGYHKSREYFQQAIDLDPTYALGYAGLSHYYGFAAAQGMLPPDENWQRAQSAARKSLELDDALAETYNSLSGVQLYYHHDWTAAEASFRKGIELNPASAEVHHHYSMCLVLFGRNEEAQAQMQRVLELEPLSVAYNLNAGKLFYFRRQYQQAIDQFNNTLELEPNSLSAHDWLGFAYEKTGKEKEAIAEWTKLLLLRKQEDAASQLRATYERSGFTAAVRVLAKVRLTELDNQVKRGDYVAAGEYATIYARLGDKEKAFLWLEKATKERNRFALEFNVNPLYDSLRSDPRFQQLADRVQIKSD